MSFLNPSTVEVADAHRKQQLLFGYCVAKASPLALVVNTLVVPCGLVILGVQMTAAPWWTIAPILAAIGCLVAILADSMTLLTAARVRKAYETTRELEVRYSQIPEDKMTEATRKQKQREEIRLKKSMQSNIAFLVFFILVSGCLADVFWHWCLSLMQQDTISWVFSALFSLLVSGAMCASQLYKADNDALIGESIEGTDFMAPALKKDANAKAIGVIARKYETEIIELAEDTDVIKAAIGEHAETIYDDLLAGGKGRIPLRIRQEKSAREYAEQREDELTQEQLDIVQKPLTLLQGGKPSAFERVREFMEANPAAINKDIVAAFPDIPANTVKSYATQIRTGKVS